MSDVTKEYLLEKLREFIEGEGTTTKEKLSAIKMALEAVVHKHQVTDVRALLVQLSTAQLKGLLNAGNITDTPPYEIEAVEVPPSPPPCSPPDGSARGLPVASVSRKRKTTGGSGKKSGANANDTD